VVDAKKWTVPMELLTAEGEKLFAFLSDCVKEVAPETVGAAEPVPMGFTFSFPVEQTAINVGKLVTWVKGFKAPPRPRPAQPLKGGPLRASCCCPAAPRSGHASARSATRPAAR
jgi:hypothetical protein